MQCSLLTIDLYSVPFLYLVISIVYVRYAIFTLFMNGGLFSVSLGHDVRQENPIPKPSLNTRNLCGF